MRPRRLRPVGTVEELLADSVDWLDLSIEGTRATVTQALGAARAEVAIITNRLTNKEH